MSQDRVLYARGFCVAREGRGGSPSWFRSVTVMGWRISVDPRTLLTSVTAADGRFVVLIGYALDISNGWDGGEQIATALLDRLGRSEEAFFETLDCLGGRYAIFYGSRAAASFVGDACATRTIYYARNEPFVASHFGIVEAASGLGGSEHWKMRRIDKRRHSTFGYPAGETPDKNVGLLMANMVLRLNSMSYERYYPRKELRPLSVQDATRALSWMFRRQLDVLASRYRIVCSLTAGLDSRCTLAALRPYLDNCLFFSYATQPKEEIDAAVARELAREYSLVHSVMPRYDRESDEFLEFRRVLSKNNYHSHNREASYGYQYLFEPGDIHIRSNLYEIGRAFYRGMRERPSELEPKGMARLYYREWSEDDADLTSAFSRYVSSSNFRSGLYGYDPYDIFYWEQRMSCWHALVLLEADPSVDTYLLMNARCCLEAALAVPQEQRIRSEVFKMLIKDSWPELLHWAVNPATLSRALRHH